MAKPRQVSLVASILPSRVRLILLATGECKCQATQRPVQDEPRTGAVQGDVLALRHRRGVPQGQGREGGRLVVGSRPWNGAQVLHTVACHDKGNPADAETQHKSQ
jgi:hypothetical protein